MNPGSSYRVCSNASDSPTSFLATGIFAIILCSCSLSIGTGSDIYDMALSLAKIGYASANRYTSIWRSKLFPSFTNVREKPGREWGSLVS